MDYTHCSITISTWITGLPKQQGTTTRHQVTQLQKRRAPHQTAGHQL